MVKYKVLNDNPFNVGIRFENEANREITIKGKSFVLMEEDDILYTDSVSKLFRNGVLTVDDNELMIKMGYMEKSFNAISESEIEALFKGTSQKIKKELEKIDAKHAIEKIVAYVKKSDLPQSKLKVVKEVFNIEIFEELDQEIV